MKVYIAGAISNNPNYKEQFEEAEEFLKKIGHTPLNPVKNLGFDYKDYIDMGLCELMNCEAIFLLPNYQESQGAMLEYQYAITVGLKLIERSENK